METALIFLITVLSVLAAYVTIDEVISLRNRVSKLEKRKR